MSTERILVQESIIDQFKPKLQAAFTNFLGPETKHSVLVSSDSATKYQVPSTHVEPTILEGVSKNMKIYYTESFGPSVTLSTFADSEEVIRVANDT